MSKKQKTITINGTVDILSTGADRVAPEKSVCLPDLPPSDNPQASGADTMNELISFTELVSVTDGKSVTSSLKVAEVFGKSHKDVLRAIRDLECPEEFNRRNFAPVDYTDAKGEKRPMYLITRDGFTLLAMGFTGEKAMKFKIAYIQAYNSMEAAIRESRVGMLTVDDVKASLVPIIRENEKLKIKYDFAKHFLPLGKPGELNEHGEAKTSFRRGYYCAGKGRNLTALVESPELPGLFEEIQLQKLTGKMM